MCLPEAHEAGRYQRLCFYHYGLRNREGEEDVRRVILDKPRSAPGAWLHPCPRDPTNLSQIYHQLKIYSIFICL